MALHSSIKFLILWGIYKSCQTNATTLADAVEAFALGHYERNADGDKISSTSTNGHSTSFAIPAGYTANDHAIFSGELVKVLLDAQVQSPADDAALFALMKDDDRLNGVTRFASDFSTWGTQCG